MTDSSPDMPGKTAETAEGWDELATLPLDEVRELFTTLAKALRAYQLYDQNNPVYQRFVANLREAFGVVWDELEHLTVRVDEEQISLGPARVYHSDTRSDSLAFLFFKDGVRELTFLPGIEEEELTRFLSVLQRARTAKSEGDDLLTILWEEDLRHLRYQYVDLLAEGVEIPEPGEGHSAAELQGVLESEVGEEEEEEEAEDVDEGPAEEEGGPKPVSREDFNPTLYSLDAREMERLRQEIEREMERDLRDDVLAALFDRLEEPENPERQSEILEVFGQLLPSFLGRGALDAATRVLEQLRSLEAAGDVFDEERQAEVSDLLDRISAPDSIQELVRALEDGSIRPGPERLSRFLGHLQPNALGPLLYAAEVTENRDLQPVLRASVRGIAGNHPRALADLLRSEDPVVLAGAARLSGRMKVAEAGPVLADLLHHEVPEVRLAAVEAATDLKASTAAGALLDLLTDSDREIRIAAARALGALRYRPAAEHFADLVTSKQVRHADLTEKIAFFESYGEVAGDDATGLLDKLLNGKGFLGRREPPELRACAALALGRIASEAAEEALRAATSEDDPVVRSAVNRALRGEED